MDLKTVPKAGKDLDPLIAPRVSIKVNFWKVKNLIHVVFRRHPLLGLIPLTAKKRGKGAGIAGTRGLLSAPS